MRAILTYHSIDPSGSPISVERATFARHVSFLASGRVSVVALEQLAELEPERNALAITFDDGFENLATEAWPRLRDAGLPATVFVATAQVGSTNAWGGAEQSGIPTLPLLDWDGLLRLAEQGLSLGSHSRTHAHLARLDSTRLEDELAGSKADLSERSGRAPRAFCYPYGECAARVVAAARAHYELACTTRLAALGAAPERHRLPRLDAYYYRRPGTLERFGGASFRAHLALRATARGLRQRWG